MKFHIHCQKVRDDGIDSFEKAIIVNVNLTKMLYFCAGPQRPACLPEGWHLRHDPVSLVHGNHARGPRMVYGPLLQAGKQINQLSLKNNRFIYNAFITIFLIIT